MAICLSTALRQDEDAKTNQITGDNPPGIRQSSSRWPTEFASFAFAVFVVSERRGTDRRLTDTSLVCLTDVDMLAVIRCKTTLLLSTRAKIINSLLPGDQPKNSSLVAPQT